MSKNLHAIWTEDFEGIRPDWFISTFWHFYFFYENVQQCVHFDVMTQILLSDHYFVNWLQKPKWYIPIWWKWAGPEWWCCMLAPQQFSRLLFRVAHLPARTVHLVCQQVIVVSRLFRTVCFGTAPVRFSCAAPVRFSLTGLWVAHLPCQNGTSGAHRQCPALNSLSVLIHLLLLHTSETNSW